MMILSNCGLKSIIIIKNILSAEKETLDKRNNVIFNELTSKPSQCIEDSI